jgi:hypothetical protein
VKSRMKSNTFRHLILKAEREVSSASSPWSV